MCAGAGVVTSSAKKKEDKSTNNNHNNHEATCLEDDEGQPQPQPQQTKTCTSAGTTIMTSTEVPSLRRRPRRGKRDRSYQSDRNNISTSKKSEEDEPPPPPTNTTKVIHKQQTKLRAKHSDEDKRGGIESLLPSLGLLGVLGFALMARMGFRGRINVAGIDLGTTNSVICIQEQTSGVGQIKCIPDPINNSSLIPSVVSFLPRHNDNEEHYSQTSSSKHSLDPYVKVGYEAKQRIDMHPQSTIYHAKRFLGRSYHSPTVQALTEEVEFDVTEYTPSQNSHNYAPLNDIPIVDIHASSEELESSNSNEAGVMFHVPTGYYPLNDPTQKEKIEGKVSPYRLGDSKNWKYYLSPEHVGSYVVSYLLHLASNYLGYDHITSAVIAVPAKFTPLQRAATARAFQMAGLKVTRVLEEPTAAALAYGLHNKANIEHILVYDFGGGTLDVSVLRVSSDSYVEVIGSEGDDTLGGADFDSVIAHYLLSTKQKEEADTTTTNNLPPKDHVERVTQALTYLARLRKNQDNNDNKITWNELMMEEEYFADHCSKMTKVPLCLTTSFHTLGEQLKIQLSFSKKATTQCLSLGESNLQQFVTEDNDAHHVVSSKQLCNLLEPVSIQLTQEEFDHAVKSLYDRSLKPIERVLENLDLSSKDIDEVVMVGGTTRMPHIRTLVKNYLQVSKLNIDIDPDITVAYGAASVID